MKKSLLIIAIILQQVVAFCQCQTDSIYYTVTSIPNAYIDSSESTAHYCKIVKTYSDVTLNFFSNAACTIPKVVETVFYYGDNFESYNIYLSGATSYNFYGLSSFSFWVRNASSACVIDGATYNIGFTLFPTCNFVVLPIKISSFIADQLPNGINLQWCASDQGSVSKYEVQASVDGNLFTTIETVNCNSNQTANYTVLDQSPSRGTSYYRIKAVENDGKITYSQIRKVVLTKSDRVKIFPNPLSTGVLNINFIPNNLNKKASLTVFSMDGKLLLQDEYNIGTLNKTIDLTSFRNGFYVVKISIDGDIEKHIIQIIK